MATKSNSRTFRRRRLALALVGAIAMAFAPSALAQNLPTGGAVIDGTVNVSTAGTTMTVDQDSATAIVNWTTFDIGAGYTVNFTQLGPSSVILNRVIGTSGSSLIAGSLLANGQVFLVNTSGIVFAAGSTVNVGSLVASTLNITDTDFLTGAGLPVPSYTFGSNTLPDAGVIINDGTITAATGGTIAMLAARVTNRGALTAPAGSVIFGAAGQATLDFYSDGLTQLAIAGNGIQGTNCETGPRCAGGIESLGTISARGGHVEMRTNTMDGLPAPFGTPLFTEPTNGGRIWIGRSIDVRDDGLGGPAGSIIIDAGMGNVDIGGYAPYPAILAAYSVAPGVDGGSIKIAGGQLFTHLCIFISGSCSTNDSLGMLDTSAFGGGGAAGGLIDINVSGLFYHAGVLQSGGVGGPGGQINITANDAQIYNWIIAEGYGASGVGGTININASSLLLHRGQLPWLGGPGTLYSQASLTAFGDAGGGAVNINVDALSVVDLGDVAAPSPQQAAFINVSGYAGSAGGSLTINANNTVSIGDTYFANVSGASAGGQVAIATDYLYLAGDIVADGGTVTTSGKYIQKIYGTASVDADQWQINGGNAYLMAASDVATAANYGAIIADAAIGSSLDAGTRVTIHADTSYGGSGSNGDIQILSGTNIHHASAEDARLDLYAEGQITGNLFNIQANDGEIDLTVVANFDGATPSQIYFDAASIQTSGGDIYMIATGNGVNINNSSLVSGGGDITLIGSSADAGVWLNNSYLYSGNAPIDYGTININGTGSVGIQMVDSTINGGGGPVVLAGTGTGAIGVQVTGGSIVNDGGSIDIQGSGYATGVYLSNTILSNTIADITIAGDGQFAGVELYAVTASATSGAIRITGNATNTTDPSAHGVEIGYSTLSTTSGDIVLYGDAIAGTALYLQQDAISSASGDITLYGNTSSTTFGYDGIFMLGAVIDSGDGDLTVRGNTSGQGDGVYANGGALRSDAGDIYVRGSSVIHSGIWMMSVGIDTQGGDLSMLGYGEQFDGLYLGGYQAISTDGGDISLHGITSDGTGLFLTGSLDSGGGAIDLYGSSKMAVGLNFVTGATGGIASGGGAIGILGYGSTIGVVLNGAGGNLIDSAGGDLQITGRGDDVSTGQGVVFNGVQMTAGTGDVTVTGDGLGGAGIYMTSAFGGSSITTTSGNISLNGTSDGSTGLLVYGAIASLGGEITLVGTSHGAWFSGVDLRGANISSDAGAIAIHGYHDTGNGAVMIQDGSTLYTNTGDITITGDGGSIAVWLYESTLTTDSGAIAVYGSGLIDGVVLTRSTINGGSGGIRLDGSGYGGVGSVNQGVVMFDSHLYTDVGDIVIIGHSDDGVGVGITLNSSLSTTSGDITIQGYSPAFAGVIVYGSDLYTTSGDITLHGEGATRGVYLGFSDIQSALDGNIAISGIGGDIGVLLHGGSLIAGDGDISLDGDGNADAGVRLDGNFQVRSDSGDIDILGYSLNGSGVDVTTGFIAAYAGDLDITGEGGTGGVLLDNVSVESTSGNIAVSGSGGSGAGLLLAASSLIDAGSGFISLAASNDGSSDALRLYGAIISTSGVNLRPYDASDSILLGSGNGFSLSQAELDLIQSPLLVIGSAQQQGQILVAEDSFFDGDLTLQNQGGPGGIDLQAALDVGAHTLGLLTGGSITQSAVGTITAHSLLASAAGDVLLTASGNNIASTTLAGSAGGDFQFSDADGLAIGNVATFGFDAGSGAFQNVNANGIGAGGNVLIRALAGDLTLYSNVSGAQIDLVTSGVFLNPGNATLTASGDWRIWASTWVGEDRGGLAGSGTLPNLYNCTYLGPCGVTVTTGSNHFIYTAQPFIDIVIADLTREYGLDNPALLYEAYGLILGDLASNALLGSLSTLATIGSDVGAYAITGSFISPAGYGISFITPGTLTITPATLLFTADPLIWYFGLPFPAFTGTVTGFRNGDTVQSVFGSNGIWFTYADPLSPPGFYPIYGGTSARNYVFAQAPGNATALQILPLVMTSDTPFQFVSEPAETYVYDSNLGNAPTCPVGIASSDDRLAAGGDGLGNEWSKVRKRINLMNCFSNDRRGGCGNF